MRYLITILILFRAVLQAAQPVIPIEKFSLKNGLRVVMSRDNAVPVEGERESVIGETVSVIADHDDGVAIGIDHFGASAPAACATR